MAGKSEQRLWDSYVLAHPEGTAFQLYAWGEAVEKAYGFQPKNIIAEFEGRICGLMPLIHFRIPILGEQLISLPYCDTGGILADNVDIAQVLWQKGLAFAEKSGCSLKIRANHSLPFAGENRTDKVRMVLELPDNSETLLAGLKSKLRSQVNKPLRDGLSARMGAGELLPDFYRIFTENMRDLGSPVHGMQWFRALIESFKDRMRITVVYAPDGKPAAAGIMLLHSTTAIVPWASSLRRYNRLNPNMLLYWTLLVYASDNGFKYFDFGRSTTGEGTWRFKAQWGSIPKPLFWYEWKIKGEKKKSVKDPAHSSKNRQLAAAFWSRLPLAGANWLGPHIRKYISL